MQYKMTCNKGLRLSAGGSEAPTHGGGRALAGQLRVPAVTAKPGAA
ncbi:hypothetical protein PHA8399_01168 [Leisingera aquaemixtae]|uniref:Uncharacterized protein n=1 Tax=Leisingera aquaemixtae TaxID=1396826 RepID=A0A0P1H7K3_9RHOB|nr:hypothetical protein PHA8399_01168 [Leisingera aquaemixtae]